MEKREYNWLDRVDSPRDLKRLSLDELRLYCDELRHYIIEQCAGKRYFRYRSRYGNEHPAAQSARGGKCHCKNY